MSQPPRIRGFDLFAHGVAFHARDLVAAAHTRIRYDNYTAFTVDVRIDEHTYPGRLVARVRVGSRDHGQILWPRIPDDRDAIDIKALRAPDMERELDLLADDAEAVAHLMNALAFAVYLQQTAVAAGR